MASALTDVARTSKAVWGYDAVFMAACRAELTLHPDSIRRDPTYLIEADGRILGFYQLRTRDEWLRSPCVRGARGAALGTRPPALGAS